MLSALAGILKTISIRPWPPVARRTSGPFAGTGDSASQPAGACGTAPYGMISWVRTVGAGTGR